MQASERARELERVYQSRRGHAPQLSISDDSHHVTEAIGDMYGDDLYAARRNSRPLSFVTQPTGDSLEPPHDGLPVAPPRSPLRAHMSSDSSKPKTPPGPNAPPPAPARRPSAARAHSSTADRANNDKGQVSPPPLSRNNSDTAPQQFPLNAVDYESSPAGLAQELSNLQAIRRMSMDVNNQADPDLPFGNFGLSTAAPQHFSEDEQDPANLFWVPARLHPELAPKEFKTFIEEKVVTIRRRSGDSDSLSPDGAMGRQGSAGGLRRKKSMLSRQIDSPNNYRDGAERLERRQSSAQPHRANGGLEQLQELVEDPTALMRSMSIESARRTSNSPDGEVPRGEDMPILPSRPAGIGALQRSRHTNYRRGSLRKGEHVPYVPFSKRMATRSDTEESPSPSTSPTHPPEPDQLHSFGLSRTQSEPVGSPFEPAENFSRPVRKRSPHHQQQRPGSADDGALPDSSGAGAVERKTSQQAKPFHSRIASNGRTTAPLPGGYTPQPIPQIIETPPPQDLTMQPPRQQLPERNSSRGPPPSAVPHQPPPPSRSQSQPQPPLQPQSSSQRAPPSRPPMPRQERHVAPIKPAQSFDELITHPSATPPNSTRTDTLSIIPSFVEEKKPEKKSKDKKDGSEGGSRKTSWGWLLGSDDKEKEVSKKKEEDREKELAKRVKNKLSKTQEKGHDDTRLDLLQTSIQGGRGRESLVLDRDRDSVKLEEERKKESTRKTSGDAKKEKESGLFSSIFGGSKKKGERDATHKKGSSLRELSPAPPPRILKPDIDYNWTRFSILEERAIYRMAHIKLANPRRELYSQVLLSNFMYSYLAKVQQMHPQIQIGTSKQARQSQQQQQQQEKAAQQKKDQPEEFTQYQRYQQDQSQKDDTVSNNQPMDNQGSDSHEDNNQQRPDSRTSQHDDQAHDSHHSSYNKANGSYSVSYNLGNPSANPQQQQSYYGYDDSDQSGKDEEMW